METNCTKCKHYAHYEDIYHCCHMSRAKTRNFVIGRMDVPLTDCKGMKKDGFCPYFEPKVPWWRRLFKR